MAATRQYGFGATGAAPWPLPTAAPTLMTTRPNLTLRSASRGRSIGEATHVARHGSGARFGVHRPSSRERQRDVSVTRAELQQTFAYRAVPAGQEEENTWADALDKVANTISINERHMRNYAQALSRADEKIAQLDTSEWSG